MKGPPDFERAMHQIYVRARDEANYRASIYLRMLYDRHGLGTAKFLINAAKVSEGYTHLYERGRLDLTVEALITDSPHWHSLFTQEELDRARKRLLEYGYTSENLG